MNTKDIEHFKSKLLAEKKQLETEMAKVGQKNPSKASGWEATSTNIEVDAADENEVADKFEEYDGNNGILTQLDNQLRDVNSAIERIANNKYGICETCGKPIERERLEANPSARISLKHGHATAAVA